MSEPVIRFVGVVYKLQTLVDGGIRLSIDLPETAIAEMAMLAETKRDGMVLRFDATVVDQHDSNFGLTGE